MGARAATVKTGSGVGRSSSAWVIGWARIFCWLFARRSATQKEVAVVGQVCCVMPFDGWCIAWQWSIGAAGWSGC
jgi:hypothetical protein